MQVAMKDSADPPTEQETDTPLAAAERGISPEAFQESLAAAERVNRHYADGEGEGEDASKLSPIRKQRKSLRRSNEQ
jgi:hypothetical protein